MGHKPEDLTNVWGERIDTCVLLSYSLSLLFKERNLFYTFISGDMITRKNQIVGYLDSNQPIFIRNFCLAGTY